MTRIVETLQVQQPDESVAPPVGRSHLPVTAQTKLPRQDVLLAKPADRFGEEVEQVVMGNRILRTFTFAVVSKWKGSHGPAAQPIDQVGDQYVTRCVRALMAEDEGGASSVFDGLPVVEIRELGTDFFQEQADSPLGQAHTYFSVQYETMRTDPTAAPQD